MRFLFVIIFSITLGCQCKEYEFPEDFMFAAGGSAYQIEGAWNLSGKSPSIADTFHHRLGIESADVSANSYFLYEDDLKAISNIGLNAYRFSISWSRLLPNGYANYINPEALEYYNKLIDGLVARNVTPMVTMLHYDTPQCFQDMGGMLNPDFVEWFSDYAVVLFEHFGDRVKYWYTFNEPLILCTFAYEEDLFPPGISLQGYSEYDCVYIYLRSHAKVFRLYDEHYRRSQNGKIGTTQIILWPEAVNDEELEIAQAFRDFWIGLVVNPIYGPNGDFPDYVKERVAEKSKELGLEKSRLPKLTQEEIEYIKGTYDFIGVNYYFKINIYSKQDGDVAPKVPSFFDDIGMHIGLDEFMINMSSYVQEDANILKESLIYIKNKYNNPLVIISENGHSETDPGLNDDVKVKYIREHLEAILESIHEHGCNVKGHTYWSLIDSFEWLNAAYESRFGLYQVDFSSPDFTRTARKSSIVLKKIIEDRKIDWNFEPDNLS